MRPNEVTSTLGGEDPKGVGAVPCACPGMRGDVVVNGKKMGEMVG